MSAVIGVIPYILQKLHLGIEIQAKHFTVFPKGKRIDADTSTGGKIQDGQKKNL